MKTGKRPRSMARRWLFGSLLLLAAVGPEASANVVSFSAPVSSSGGENAPVVTAGGPGEYLATLSFTSSTYTIQRSTDGGRTWSPLSAVPSELEGLPRLIFLGGSDWLLVADSRNTLGGTIDFDPDILFSRSTDGGATWSTPAALNDTAATDNITPAYVDEDYQPSIVRVGPSSWLAMWVSLQRPDSFYDDELNWRLSCATSTDNGLSWSATSDCISLGDEQRGIRPDVASDGSGAVVAIWSVGTAFDQLFSSYSTDNGATWSAPLLHDPPGFTDTRDQPRVVTDGAGTWVLVKTSRGFTEGIENGAMLLRRSTDGGATWGPPVQMPNNLSPKNLSGFAREATMAYSAIEDAWVLAWRQVGFGFPFSEDDIFYAVSHDGAQTWTIPAVANANGSRDSDIDFKPRVAAGSGGGWVLRWLNTAGAHSAFAIVDCPVLPAAGCRTTVSPGRSKLDLSSSRGPRDQIKWKWSGHATDLAGFGAPELGDPYILCLYDDVGTTPRLILEKDIPTPSLCPGTTCWEATSKGYRYDDRKRLLTSTSKVDLRAGDEGRARFKLLSKGASVAPPALALGSGSTARAQLINTSTGACWQADFSTPNKNTDTRYKALSD